jgi:hypothetical protein
METETVTQILARSVDTASLRLSAHIYHVVTIATAADTYYVYTLNRNSNCWGSTCTRISN